MTFVFNKFKKLLVNLSKKAGGYVSYEPLGQSWDLKFRRGYFDRELNDWASLSVTLENYIPSTVEDRLAWRLESRG